MVGVIQIDLDAGDLLQRKSQFLRLFDEPQKLDKFRRVVAVSVLAAIRRRNDALALVKPDARGGDAGGVGDFSDFQREAP